MHCRVCKFWGDGNGKGIPYDAGPVNYCNNLQISGMQHPSYGSCNDSRSMLIVAGAYIPQLILTRSDFGCLMYETGE